MWIYGDSVGDFFYRANFRKPLCTKAFKSCNRTYNWIYNIIDDDLNRARIETDNKDFSKKRVISELKKVLLSNEVDVNSLILLNYGLHFVQDVQYIKFVEMIDIIIETIREFRQANKLRANIIWRTTTALQKWKYGDPKTNARHGIPIRFLTTPVSSPL